MDMGVGDCGLFKCNILDVSEQTDENYKHFNSENQVATRPILEMSISRSSYTEFIGGRNSGDECCHI
jgi:hypothetical protein